MHRRLRAGQVGQRRRRRALAFAYNRPNENKEPAVLRKLLVLGVCVSAFANAEAEQRWLTAADRGLSTDGKVESFALPTQGSSPSTIAIAPDGRVWFTESNGNRIGRIDPDGTNLVEFPLPNPGSSPRIIALGADGNMWFSEHAGNRMGRITPDGVITEFELPTPNGQPRAIALGADGNVWIGLFAAGKIARITPAGVITEFAIPTPNSGPRALAAGPDGNVWFSEYRTSKIGRITPQGKITEFDLDRKSVVQGRSAGVGGV